MLIRRSMIVLVLTSFLAIVCSGVVQAQNIETIIYGRAIPIDNPHKIHISNWKVQVEIKVGGMPVTPPSDNFDFDDEEFAIKTTLPFAPNKRIRLDITVIPIVPGYQRAHEVMYVVLSATLDASRKNLLAKLRTPDIPLSRKIRELPIIGQRARGLTAPPIPPARLALAEIKQTLVEQAQLGGAMAKDSFHWDIALYALDQPALGEQIRALRDDSEFQALSLPKERIAVYDKIASVIYGGAPSLSWQECWTIMRDPDVSSGIRAEAIWAATTLKLDDAARKEFLPFCREQFKDSSSLTYIPALVLLAKMDAKEFASVVNDSLREDSDYWRMKATIAAIDEVKYAGANAALVALTKQQGIDPSLRLATIETLGHLGATIAPPQAPIWVYSDQNGTEPDFKLNVDTRPHHLVDWTTDRRDQNGNHFLECRVPGSENAFIYFSYGDLTPNVDLRKTFDISKYQYLVLEVKGEEGVRGNVDIGVKANTDPDTGNEPKSRRSLSADWTTIRIPLSTFVKGTYGADRLEDIYIATELVWDVHAQGQKVFVRRIRFE